MRTFPFGQAVAPCEPSNRGPRTAFVLGAYPSALHIRWKPPFPWRPINAMAVANEPEPFWTGLDEAERIAAWKRVVGWKSEWGRAAGAGRLNGSSGLWVQQRILCPLRLNREQICITDCLDTYRVSKSASKRIDDTVVPFTQQFELSAVDLLPHPSESAIVSEALETHAGRIRALLVETTPTRCVTLGNAALRVFRQLVAAPQRSPQRLSTGAQTYGMPIPVTLPDGRQAEWLPLAHPASPVPYQRAHDRWIRARESEQPER